MEKDFRLFVKNLPISIQESDVKNLLEKYVAVKKIDLKEKKDLDNKIHKFAFVNVTTTDKKLYTCFGALNGERIDGFEITVEVAKESFLERLKREREENKLKQTSTPEIKQEPLKSVVLPNTLHSSSQSKHKKFFDDDLPTDHQIEETKPKKERKEYSKIENFEKVDESTINNEKHIYLNVNDNECKIKHSNKKLNQVVQVNKKSSVQKISQKSEISESEKKRLMSLKQKKQVFKAQEQTIRNALRFVDNYKMNNKIVFDEDMELDHSKEFVEKPPKKSNTLFDSDDEQNGEELKWNEEELEAKANIKQKLMKFQTNTPYDKRFVLDERFIEDESEDENKNGEQKTESSKNTEVLDEKQWQLNILNDVLGKKIEKPTLSTKISSEKKSKMIRYDPTASNHQDFEVTIDSTKKKDKKIKKKEEKKEDTPPPIPRSEEIFFDVKKIDIGTSSGGFSLLKACDRDPEEEDNSKRHFKDEVRNNINKETNNNQSNNFKMNFNSKNPFKYDSSDGEYEEEDTKKNNTSNKFNFVLTPRESNLLFFTNNDPRFEEAKEFFKTSVVQEEQEFKNKRRGLKQIVRSKIRNNMKKKVPWNRKKVQKVRKNVNK